jgi:hypothetical protein
MLETPAISNPQSLAKKRFVDRFTECRVEDADGSVRSARVLGGWETPGALPRAKKLRYLEQKRRDIIRSSVG